MTESAIRRDRGALSPSMEAAVTYSPEIMEHFYEVMRIARREGTGALPDAQLDAKWRELITVAILTSIPSESGLRLHIGKALDLGATPKEVAETLEPCLVTLGAPAFLAGMAALHEVLKHRQPPSGADQLR
jgi:alkylhydroperoxidase/carboxymuconolactone decarboxylase family protein YurZ